MDKHEADILVLSPRERLSYTRHQLQLLNAIFERVPYPNTTQKQIIAFRIGINREQVKVWFQNRRRKEVLSKLKKTESWVDKNSKKSAIDSQDDTVINTRQSPVSESKAMEYRCISPEVVTSIIQELEQFNNTKYKGAKTGGENTDIITEDNEEFQIATNKKRKCLEVVAGKKVDQIEINSIKQNSSKSQNKCKKGYLQSTKSSKKNNIFISAYDIKSPPNQITPTAIFTLNNNVQSTQSSPGFSCWTFINRVNNSLTDKPAFMNYSFANSCSSSSSSGRHQGSMSDPSVVSFSSNDSYDSDQVSIFSKGNCSMLNGNFWRKHFKAKREPFMNIPGQLTPQHLHRSPFIYENTDAFQFFYKN
ncbi:homeobox protein Mix.2-like [Argonauta hians]